MAAPLANDDVPLLEVLSRRSASDNLPLLLALARRLSARRTAGELVRQYARDPFVRPSAIDQRVAHRLDGIALEAASEFEAVLLSPLAPLGSCSVVSPTTQDRAVTTVRGSEVVSDPTNVLALECARRLHADATARIRLCTLHEVVRPQRFEPRPGFSQHFRLFAAAEAGRALPEHEFEVRALAEHAASFFRIFELAERLGHHFPERKLRLLVAPDARAVGDRAAARLAERFTNVELERGVLESTYYSGVRLLVGARATNGEHVELGDVGLFDWMRKLTSNRRYRFVASGFGIQLLPLLFR